MCSATREYPSSRRIGLSVCVMVLVKWVQCASWWLWCLICIPPTYGIVRTCTVDNKDIVLFMLPLRCPRAMLHECAWHAQCMRQACESICLHPTTQNKFSVPPSANLSHRRQRERRMGKLYRAFSAHRPVMLCFPCVHVQRFLQRTQTQQQQKNGADDDDHTFRGACAYVYYYEKRTLMLAVLVKICIMR